MSLPYLDLILERLAAGDPDFTTAFPRYIHWGYWESHPPDITPAGLGQAAHRLTEVVLDWLEPCGRVVDVGCGLGGVCLAMAERFPDCTISGFDRDERLLAHGRRQAGLFPRLELQRADASALPLQAASVDRVLALECVFHFGDRAPFLAECARVLRTGGRVVLTDYIPRHWISPLLRRRFPTSEDFFGSGDLSFSLSRYRRLALALGFKLTASRDLTRPTLPTYRAFSRLFAGSEWARPAQRALRMLEWPTRLGIISYSMLRLDKL